MIQGKNIINKRNECCNSESVGARSLIGLLRNAAPKSFWFPCIQVTDILKRKLLYFSAQMQSGFHENQNEWDCILCRRECWFKTHFSIFLKISIFWCFFYYFQYIFCHSQFLIKFSSKSQNVFATENENQKRFTFKRNKSSPLMHLFQIFISNVPYFHHCF